MQQKLYPETTYQSVIGRVLVKLRKDLNKEQAFLAAQVGVTQSTWSRIERGESSFTVEQLAKVADCLQIKPSTILSETEKAILDLKSQGVLVRMGKLSKNKGMSTGAVIGIAALSALVGSAITKAFDNET
jgi:transcriptional regulator with XRE-family HTH domain